MTDAQLLAAILPAIATAVGAVWMVGHYIVDPASLSEARMTEFSYDPKNSAHYGPQTGNLLERVGDGGLTFAIITGDSGHTFVSFEILGYVPLMPDGVAAAEEVTRRFKGEQAFREEMAEIALTLGCNYRQSALWPECRPLPNLQALQVMDARSRPPNAPS